MFKSSTIRSGNNAKTEKSDRASQYETAIMYLAPANLAFEGRTVCSMAVLAGCIGGCLNTAGRGAFSNVQQARIAKTKRYFEDRKTFMAQLAEDLAAFVRYCARKGVKPAVRLNGTSDIMWEVGHPVSIPTYRNGSIEERGTIEFTSIFAAFPEVEFYDYTKITKRVLSALPANYSLTLSYSEASPRYAAMVIDAAKRSGANVAVVYRTKAQRDQIAAAGGDHLEHGERMMNRPVIDGDETDLRFLDQRGVIVGLYAKGSAKTDTSGFVVG